MRPARLAPLVLVLLPALAGGQTITVPADAATIQAAVDQATPGTEILIKGGVYVENVVVDGHTDVALKAKGKVVIRPALGVGVTVSNSTGILLEKLRVEGSATFGIHVVESTGVTISKAQVKDAGGDSIRTDGGSDITIDRCKIEGGDADAIALSTVSKIQTSGSFVTNNKIKGPFGDGVIVNGDNNLIEDNLALQPGDNGFQIDSAGLGTGNVFRGNRVIESDTAGLLANDLENTFEDNVVVRAGGPGMAIDGTGHTFTGNKIVRPAGGGVTVEGTGHTVAGNVFVKPGGSGAVASGSGHLLEDNIFTKPGIDGLRNLSATSTLRGNKVSKPGEDGIDLEGNDCLVESNTVSKAGDDGFEVSGIGNTIQDNSAKGSFFFDLFDVTMPGQNTYSNNAFKTVFP